MFDILTETFLYEYFLNDAILGAFYDRKVLFFRLGELFCLSEEEITELFYATESEAIREISSEDDYKRYKRIKQYNELVGNEQGYSETEDNLIAIKGDAIMTVTRYGMKANDESTKTLIVKTLMGGAQSGNITALRILGILQCEGITVEKDNDTGVKYLKKAMQWGDIPAMLGMLKYSGMDKAEVMKMLSSALKNTPYEFLPSIVKDKYGVIGEDGYSEEIFLIKQAVNANKLKYDIYDSMYARLIYSDAIDIKDKEKILFSENKELISEACNLPLRLKFADITVDESAVESITLEREEEQQSVIQGLYNSDIRLSDAYRPICLCSGSEYVLETYISAICKALNGTHIERIEVGELRDFDVEPTKNNVFVRGLNEKENNVYLLVFKGNVSDATIEFTKAVLKSDKRRKFCLNNPAVTLDLSSVLPICVCDKENVKKLKNFVEFIELEPVQADEKPSVIKDILEKKKSVYSIGEITISADVTDKLCSFSAERAEKILDKAIRANRKKGKALDLSMDKVSPYFNKTSENDYGFGGIIHESK